MVEGWVSENGAKLVKHLGHGPGTISLVGGGD